VAGSHFQDYLVGTTKSPQESLYKAIDFAQRAIAQDDSLFDGHRMVSLFYWAKREYDKGLAEGERALDLDPNGAESLNNYALLLNYAGRTDEAIPLFQKSIRLNPKGPTYFFNCYGEALRYKGRFDESVSAHKKALQRAPNYILAHLGLAATYGLMGRENEARAEVEEVLKINPKISLDYLVKTDRFKDQSLREKYYYNPLRKAGLK
jgi:adenylate cyclase